MDHATPESFGEVGRLLANMEKLSASDLHIKAYAPPIYRVHGSPQRIKAEPLTGPQADALILQALSAEQKEQLAAVGSVDLALSIVGVGRFRVNVFRQRGSLSFVARRVSSHIPGTDELNLPKSVNRVSGLDDGFVLVVGATGSGKSTTLASLISRINSNRKCHILTIEDPIEFLYRDDKAFVNQREIGLDVGSFNVALKYALRQDPDVILVGEMRDADTIETALAASETGHLVFSTLHANNCMQTVSRILDFFSGDRQHQIRQMLAFCLRTVMAQRLVAGCKPEFPRVPAVEIMFVNAVIRKLIEEGDDAAIPEALKRAANDGMQDFNMSLHALARQGLITEQVAIDNSTSPEQLRMLFRGMVLNQDQGAFG